MDDTSPTKRLIGLTTELKRIRQGRGIHDHRITYRIGDALRAAIGLDGDEDLPTTRGALAASLVRNAASMPPKVRDALHAAFGLDGEEVYYQDRLALVATRYGVTPRTVRRWVESGLTALARALASELSVWAWWTERVVVALVLDRPRPEVLAVHRVVAGVDGLDEIEVDMATGVDDGDGHHVFYGGTLRRTGLGPVLDLPEPLAKGGIHEFAVHTRLPETWSRATDLLWVPRYRCDLVEVRVRFPAHRVPRRVHPVTDVPHGEVDGPPAGAATVRLDAAGEAHAAFPHPSPGQVSGLRWRHD